MFVVAALYKFVALADLPQRRQALLDFCLAQDIKGTLLLAHEGINGTVSGTRAGVDALLAHLHGQAEFADLEHKESIHADNPFFRMKIKLKKEIVTLGVAGVDPTKRVGSYVEPQDWNALIASDDVLVLDTRNDYEVAIGSFANALDPHTKSFREFPEYVKTHLDANKNKRVAMFCTGGIRCEKASAYMLAQGFAEVYHLKGGILNYLEKVQPEDSLWHGECFVFDNRVAVDHHLAKGQHEFCPGCRGAVSPQDKLSDKYSADLCCPRCHDQMSAQQLERFTERQKQIRLARERGQLHFGHHDE